ncbi:MAG: hypothetical protein VKL20_06745 [Synechocystis sp.]|nr:hypothetical protein [Synechocystis sp.]
MESLFLVLGIIGGLIAGFAITYFAFVGKLQKKLASAKKKLDRAQSVNEEAETLQSQLNAQKSERQGAEAKLASLEAAHQTQISELEAELASLRQASVALEQSPPDHSEELAALQARLAEVEQQHQETLQARLAEVEQQHQETLQALESRHQDELEALRQSFTVAPPSPMSDTESLAPEPTDQGNWGAAAIAGGAAAIGAGMAALSNFGQSSPPETTEELESFPEDLIAESEPEPAVESEIPAAAEWTEEIDEIDAEIPEAFSEEVGVLEEIDVEIPEAFSEEVDVLEEVAEIPEISDEEDSELAAESLAFSEFEAGVEGETPAFADLTEELLPDAEPSPFEQSPFDQDAFPETPAAETAETDDLSPFGPPETPVMEQENWVDMPDATVSHEEGMVESFGGDEEFPALDLDEPSPFESAAALDLETDNWVDAPDNIEQVDDEFDIGESPADLLPDFPETAETALLDVDNLLSEEEETEALTAELPDMGDADLGLGLELPDMTEEPDLGEFSFGDQTLEELGDDIPDGDELLAELTGTGEADDAGLGLFALEETTAETEALEEDLSLPSNPGDTLEMPDSFLADIPSFIPDSDTDTEDISEVGTGSDDDLNFLLQLQEDEPPSFPGEEFLPEFNDDDPLSANFPTMELLADDNSELSDLLGEGRPAHEGDPFINILDENPPASDNELLALLQDGEGGGVQPHESDDDLFSGLEGMLNTDTPDDESDLNDLDALLNSSGESSKDHDEVFSLEDLGLGEDKF